MATFGFALEFDKIDTTMEKNINQTIHILQTSNKSIESIAKEIFAMFDSIFDYHLMAQLSLSKNTKPSHLANKKNLMSHLKKISNEVLQTNSTSTKMKL